MQGCIESGGGSWVPSEDVIEFFSPNFLVCGSNHPGIPPTFQKATSFLTAPVCFNLGPGSAFLLSIRERQTCWSAGRKEEDFLEIVVCFE